VYLHLHTYLHILSWLRFELSISRIQIGSVTLESGSGSCGPSWCLVMIRAATAGDVLGRYPTEATRLRFDHEKSRLHLIHGESSSHRGRAGGRSTITNWRFDQQATVKWFSFLVESQSRRLSGRTTMHFRNEPVSEGVSPIRSSYVKFLSDIGLKFCLNLVSPWVLHGHPFSLSFVWSP
jgi:hypothetical protein